VFLRFCRAEFVPLDLEANAATTEEVDAACATSPGLTRPCWGQFVPCELDPGRFVPTTCGVRTLMSVDKREDGGHACLIHDRKGGGVTNPIERRATVASRLSARSGAVNRQQVDVRIA
jgi:hypothetical protein